MIGWADIALRLGLTLLAGGLIGLDRSEGDRPAGLRTTLLVCLAAAIAMIQANLLLSLAGKASDSFVVMDLMRLPLGILSGVGFIGAGAIIRRGDRAKGVTTAATLWFATVVGLCFGGGQLGLGVAATVLAIVVLIACKWIEHRLPRTHRFMLVAEIVMDAVIGNRLRQMIEEEGYHGDIVAAAFSGETNLHEIRWELRWRGRSKPSPPKFLTRMAADPKVHKFRWDPIGAE